jgi:hypothetical protein
MDPDFDNVSSFTEIYEMKILCNLIDKGIQFIGYLDIRIYVI